MAPRKLNRQLARIAAGQPLRRGRRIDADDAEVLRTALALRATASHDEPDPDFVAGLAGRLKAERDPVADRSRRPTRRSVLAGGLVAAAAGGAGVLAGATGFATGRSGPAGGTLAPTDGAWTPVASQADLDAKHAIVFEVDGVHGVLSKGTDGKPVAVSGVCTHQGCVLMLLHQDASPTLECPCHRAVFATDGAVVSHRLHGTLDALPRLEARLVGQTTEVFLPKGQPAVPS
jgi:cytochrome b6-f complex iron-sulfur subunit